MEKKTIVFDLDDTLVKEIDFLKSAFREIAAYVDPDDSSLYGQMIEWYGGGLNVFENLEKITGKELKDALKNIYRNHVPDFTATTGIKEMLQGFKNDGHFLGMITDGYSVTQRNKLKALDIETLFDLIVVSEEFGSTKPSEKNFEVFHKFGTKEYFYISDNVTKDFIAPNKLGWTTICLLDDGRNIHRQDFNKDSVYLPAQKIEKLAELQDVINRQ